MRNRVLRVVRSTAALVGCAAALGTLAASPGLRADDASFGVDPAFGDGGFVAISPNAFSSFEPTATADALGRVLALNVELDQDLLPVATRTHVRRFLPDGTLDLSFGSDGQFVIEPEITGQGTNSPYLQVAADALGRVIVVRGADADLRPRAEREVSVRRFTESGQIDATFGVLGRVVIAAPDQLDTHGKASVVVDSGGNVLVAYTQLGPGTPAKPTVRIVKFTDTGEIDETFGESGFAMLPANYASWPNAMALDSQGRIVVAGAADYEHDVPTVHHSIDPTILLARFLADGTPDPAFDAAAALQTDSQSPKGEVTSFVFDAGGNIVADTDQRIYRFDADGRNATLVATQLEGGTAVPVGPDSFLTWQRSGDGGFFAQSGPNASVPEGSRIATNAQGSFALFRRFVPLPGGSMLAVGQVPFFTGLVLVKFAPGGVALGPDLQVAVGSLEIGSRAMTGKLTVTNNGPVTGRSSVRFFLSDDAVADASDDELKAVRVGRVGAGESKTVRFRVPLSRKLVVNSRFVLAVADAKAGTEAWRADNTAVVGPIR